MAGLFQRVFKSNLRLFLLGVALALSQVVSSVYLMDYLPFWPLYFLLLVAGLLCCSSAIYRAHPRMLAVLCLASLVLGLLPMMFPPPDQVTAPAELIQATKTEVRAALSWNGETRILGLTTTAISLTSIDQSANEWVATGDLYTFYFLKSSSFDISLGHPPPGGSIGSSGTPVGLVFASWLVFLSTVVGSVVSVPLLIVKTVRGKTPSPLSPSQS
jgi:hypothetical protein